MYWWFMKKLIILVLSIQKIICQSRNVNWRSEKIAQKKTASYKNKITQFALNGEGL